MSGLLGSNLSPAALWVTLGTLVSPSAPRFHPHPTPPGSQGFLKFFPTDSAWPQPHCFSQGFPIVQKQELGEKEGFVHSSVSPPNSGTGREAGRWRQETGGLRFSQVVTGTHSIKCQPWPTSWGRCGDRAVAWWEARNKSSGVGSESRPSPRRPL